MSSIKSILIVSTEFPPAPGGIGSHAYALANELTKLNWKVIVATEQNYTTQIEIDKFNQSQDFPIYQLQPTPRLFSLVRKTFFLIKLIIKNKPKYISGTGKHGAWFAFLISKICFKKSILIGHGTEFTVPMSKNSKKVNNYVYSNSNLLIPVSYYTRNIIESTGIQNKNTQVIHNGANHNNYYKLTNEVINEFKKTNNLNEKKLIITLGNVTPRKGQEWVIRSLPQIIQKHPTTHYFCIGLPTIKNELEKLSIELGVSENIHFLGRLSNQEINQWLNASDIFAMTSVNNKGDFEGFGISVIEAALCAKMAIVTNESGVLESIVDNVTGFGVPERDSLAISQKIIYVLDNIDVKSKMDRNAFERAINEFTWEKIILNYQDKILQL